MDIVIFGASNCGKSAFCLWNEQHNILAFCDNDMNKVGTTLEGIKIIGVEELKKIYKKKKIKILIASMYYEVICNQLLQESIRESDIVKFTYSLTPYTDYRDKLSLNFDMRYTELNFKKDKHLYRYIHILPDSKHSVFFMNLVNKELEAKEHKFIITTKDLTKELMYIDQEEHLDIETIFLDNEIDRLLYYIQGTEKIFIHYFTIELAEVMSRINLKQYVNSIGWIVWGGELYQYNDRERFETRTKELMGIKKVYLSDKYQIHFMKKALQQVNLIACWLEQEYQLIKEVFDTNIKRVEMGFPSPIDVKQFSLIKNKKISKIKDSINKKYLIFLGNSASWTNNHADVLYRLKEIDDETFGIVVPLAYGAEDCKESIYNLGKSLFGNRFIPLLNMSTGEEYYEIMQQCDVIIMNHRVQEGGHNVKSALLLEKKLYLNRYSPIYKHYINKKVKIFEIQSIQGIKDLFDYNFDTHKNYEIMKDLLDEKAIKDKILNVIKKS